MRWLLCVLLILLPAMIVPPAQAQEDEPAPYLYYYSDVLNGIVIERADGTDSRIIGQGLVKPGFVYGPGWTPDGQWFAGWTDNYDIAGPDMGLNGAVVRRDGYMPIEDLVDVSQVFDIVFDESFRYVLIQGHFTKERTNVRSYWLFDINSGKNLAWETLVLSLDGHSNTPPIEWSLETQQVSFYGEEFTPVERAVPVRVTMHFDGRIEKAVISVQDYEALLPQHEIIDNSFDLPLDSPSGRYVGEAFVGRVVDTWTNTTLSLPGDSEALYDEPATVRWHPSEKWVLLGYEWCATDCNLVGNVSVMSLDGKVIRKLGSCGFSSACVGWLPDTVDVNALPPGAPQSVLPAPITIEPTYRINDKRPSERYQATCNNGINRQNAIRDVETGKIVFVMPHVTGYCYESFFDPEFAYAVSLDGQWYAVNEPLHEHWISRSTVYEMATGERLFSLNINAAYGLEFSPDGRYLTTHSRYADSVWDLEQLLATYGSE